MTAASQPARRNIGGLNSREIPADRFIVGGAFVLMDDDGNHSVYFAQQPAMASFRSSPMPSDEVLMEIAAMLAAAWDIAAIDSADLADPAHND